MFPEIIKISGHIPKYYLFIFVRFNHQNLIVNLGFESNTQKP